MNCDKSLALLKALNTRRKIGIRFITDEKRKKRFVQIDMDRLEKHQGEIEELLDVIIAESRKNDEVVSWEEVKKQLKTDGKL